MASVKLKLRFGDAELEYEGEYSHSLEITETWWRKVAQEAAPPSDKFSAPDLRGNGQSPPPADKSRARPARTAKAAASGAAPNGGDRVDANEIANSLKADPRFREYEEKILHKRPLYNKVALICAHAGKPLTSGDIQRVLRSLMVKVDPSDVSKTLGKNSSSFFMSRPRTQGGPPPQYEMTGSAKVAFERSLNE